MNLKNILYYIYLFGVVGSLPITMVLGAGELTSALCAIINNVKGMIGLLAIALFLSGGSLYAFAHVMPAAGNLKGNLQGWSLGLIVGGVVGLLLVLIAPTVIGFIVGISGATSAPITTC